MHENVNLVIKYSIFMFSQPIGTTSSKEQTGSTDKGIHVQFIDDETAVI